MKYRALWAGAMAGLALHLGGLAWDVYRHSADSTLAQREDVLSLANPSHLMIVVGMAVVAACLLGVAFAWLQERNVGGSGPAGVMLRGIGLPLIGVVAAGSIWLASQAEDGGHAHGDTLVSADHLHPGGLPAGHDHAHAEETGVILAVMAAAGRLGDVVDGTAHSHDEPEPGSMDEGSAHHHGQEVPVTGEQLAAASEFVATLKQHTAQYEDVRAAMADGYAQITPDLPGIAAHFIRGNYQRDGREMDPEHPEVLLYTKRLDGEWRLVGAMFLAEQMTEEPPSYFGPLDSWHYHSNLCFTAGAGVRAVGSRGDCLNGVFVARTAWQLHVWTAPGGNGIFAHDYAPISPGAFPGASKPAAAELLVQAP
ncbi:MAG: hypothetical protein FIB00_05160 [Chloroflexi bacterium]|nr:hypothetical protein [Chloroflexota bacterium]